MAVVKGPLASKAEAACTLDLDRFGRGGSTGNRPTIRVLAMAVAPRAHWLGRRCASRTAKRLATTCLLLVAACGVRRTDSIELLEVASVRLQSGFVPSGAVLADNGAFLLWSRALGVVLASRVGGAAALCPGRTAQPIGAAFVRGDTAVEIVLSGPDGAGVEVLQSSLGGTCSLLVRARGSEDALSASRCGSVWVVGRRSPGVSWRLEGLDDSGRKLWTVSDSSTGTSPDGSRAMVAEAGRGVLVSSMDPPFRSAHVDCLGRIGARLQLDPDSVPARRGWIGLRVVEFQGGYLQVIADPRSDRRLLVAFDTRGRALRGRQLNVAFGFLASSPDRKHVIALRRTDVDEVVTYAVQVDPTARRR